MSIELRICAVVANSYSYPIIVPVYYRTAADVPITKQVR